MECWNQTIGKEVQSLSLHTKSFGVPRQDQLPIILLHGWANSIDVISTLAESLSKFFYVIAVDLPGHGRSQVPELVWDMQAFASSLKKTLDENNIYKATFVGHSFGGKTIIKFADLFPEYVEKIVLLGASGLRARPSLKKRIFFLYLKLLRNFIRFKNTKLGRKIYESWYIPRYASRDYKNAGPMTKTFVKTLNEQLSLELSRISKPALLIWGNLDDESPPCVGQQMNELLTNSKLVILEGRDHYPFLGNGLSLVTKYIRDFLR